MQKIRWFIWVVLIAAAITLAVQNNAPAPVRILWIERELPLTVLLITTTGIGFLAGAMMTALTFRRSRRRGESAKPKRRPSDASPPPKTL